MAAGCNGCHGGGGMGRPDQSGLDLGKDDDTLFRLIALGRRARRGHSRKGSENVVGPIRP